MLAFQDVLLSFGIVMGSTSRKDLKEYFLSRGITEADFVALDASLAKFYLATRVLPSEFDASLKGKVDLKFSTNKITHKYEN